MNAFRTCAIALLVLVAAPRTLMAEWVREPHSIAWKVGGHIAWQFTYDPKLGKPFFHPLAVGANASLTNFKPVDHPWHYALWFSWKYINQVNYWEEDRTSGKAAGSTQWDTPTIETQNDGGANITLRLRYTRTTGEVDVTETRVLQVSAPSADGSFTIDWDMAFTAGVNGAVLDRTPMPGEPNGAVNGGYAGLALRVVGDPVKMSVVTTEGPVSEFVSDRARPNTAAVAGNFVENGRNIGNVAILSAASNIREKAPWYIINSGKDFEFICAAILAPAVRTLPAGGKWDLKYRVAVSARAFTQQSLTGAVNLWKQTASNTGQPNRMEQGTSIERLDPAINALIAPDAQIEQLARGYAWSEGPVWRKATGDLLFSDVPRNTIFRYKVGEGVSVFMRPSGYTGPSPPGRELGSNGLTLDARGRVVMADHGNRQVARLDDSLFTKTTLADRYNGKRFNSPNDLVYRANGDLYFTDPPFGLRGLNNDPAKELAENGVYRVTPAGVVTLLTSDLRFPNGIAFSPDERTLYVSNADGGNAVWMAYPVKTDGTLEKGRVLFDATALAKQGRRGVPDGMRVDAKGNLFAAGPGGVLIISPQGKHLGTIMTGQPTANCTFGDDGSTLYITANDRLLRVRLLTKGAGL